MEEAVASAYGRDAGLDGEAEKVGISPKLERGNNSCAIKCQMSVEARVRA